MPPRTEQPTQPTSRPRPEHGPTENAATAGSGAAVSAHAAAPPTHIHRYVVREQIGRGGMGTVYRAFDPALDRDIALKLLADKRRADPTRAGRDHERIFREAQALAKLSHPNVIAVHDVGTFRGAVFVAMELVRGQTALAWLRERPRGWREVVAVFAAAGDGLAAAHAAGIVHRDVKPGNIVIGDDGRVRVIDFGLARAAEPDAAADDDAGEAIDGATVEPAALRAVGSARHRPLLAQSLTTVGALCGTPQYMAPEQRLGGKGGEAADQFSLCASLYEGLYRERPYRDDGLPARPSARVTEGRGRAEAKVPAHIHRALMRGLAVHAGERFGSIAELVAALRRDPGARRRRLAAAAGVAALAALAGIAFAPRGAAGDRCPVDHAAARAMWSPAAADAIGKAFAATGRSYAADTAARVGAALAQRATAWGAMRKASCEATWVQGTQSEALLDLRSECLAERRTEQLALVALLSQAALDAATVDRAVEAVAGLPAVADCADTHALRSTQAPPPPGSAEKVAALRAQIAELRVHTLAGDYRAAVAAGEPLVAAARALDYAPLLGEASYEYAMALSGAGEFVAAQGALERAMEAAATASDDHTAALAAARWLWVVGYALDGRDKALLSVPMARSLAARVASDALVKLTLHGDLATVLVRVGDYQGAQSEFQEALEIGRRNLGITDLRMATLHHNLGALAYLQGRNQEAVAELIKARDLRRASLGPSHPDLGRTLSNLGLALLAQEYYREALATCREAANLLEQAMGSEDLELARALRCVADGLRLLDRPNEAVPFAERSLRIRLQQLAPSHIQVGYSATTLARLYLGLRRNTEALDLFRRAIPAFEPAHPELVDALLGLGRGLSAVGRGREALAAIERAVAFAGERTLPTLPDAEAALAKALWRSDRPRARALADKALAAFAAADRQPEHDELAAWLAARR